MANVSFHYSKQQKLKCICLHCIVEISQIILNLSKPQNTNYMHGWIAQNESENIYCDLLNLLKDLWVCTKKPVDQPSLFCFYEFLPDFGVQLIFLRTSCVSSGVLVHCGVWPV